MSTSTQPLTYLWEAIFDDGHIINQPADDRYSKHDDTAKWNPSAFRDIIEYPAGLLYFTLSDKFGRMYQVDVRNGVFHTSYDGGVYQQFSLENIPLIERKLIYFREMHQEFNMAMEGGEPYVNRYCMGYEGKDPQGKVIKKVIYING